MMNFQVAKKKNKPAYQRPITVLFLLQLLLLDKLTDFSLGKLAINVGLLGNPV